MSPLLRAILPYALISVMLVVIAVVLLLSHHHVAAFVVLGVDGANLMVMRYKMFRWVRARHKQD